MLHHRFMTNKDILKKKKTAAKKFSVNPVIQPVLQPWAQHATFTCKDTKITKTPTYKHSTVIVSHT